jgi:hypothetical protein
VNRFLHGGHHSPGLGTGKGFGNLPLRPELMLLAAFPAVLALSAELTVTALLPLLR